jgi:hypothetical protein
MVYAEFRCISRGSWEKKEHLPRIRRAGPAATSTIGHVDNVPVHFPSLLNLLSDPLVHNAATTTASALASANIPARGGRLLSHLRTNSLFLVLLPSSLPPFLPPSLIPFLPRNPSSTTA